MDTSILHTRILEYKEKAKNPLTKDVLFLFESWFLEIENYMSGLEIDNFYLNNKIRELQEIINALSELLIITGNADKLFAIDLRDQNTRDAISLIMKSKDRKNADAISAISALLYINSDKKFESVQQLKEYVNGE